MKKIIYYGIASVIIITLIIASSLNNFPLNVEPYQIFEVKKGEEISFKIPYQNNNTSSDVDVNIILTVPAVISLTDVQFFSPYISEGEQIQQGIGHLIDHSYVVEYDSLLGREQQSGKDIDDLSFEAKKSSEVKYTLSYDIDLYQGEKVDFGFIFTTTNADVGSYDIKIKFNGNSILYRADVLE